MVMDCEIGIGKFEFMACGPYEYIDGTFIVRLGSNIYRCVLEDEEGTPRLNEAVDNEEKVTVDMLVDKDIRITKIDKLENMPIEGYEYYMLDASEYATLQTMMTSGQQL